MRTTAQNVITAAQNALWPNLLWRIASSLAVTGFFLDSTTFGRAAPPWLGTAWLALVGLTLAMVGGMWLVGHLAIRPLENHGSLQALQRSPANGFEAWGEFPEGGLRPSRTMRRLVDTLGRPLPGPLAGLLALSVVASWLAAMTAFLMPDWLAAHCPALSSPRAAWIAFGLLVLLMISVQIRGWAMEARARLGNKADAPATTGT